MTTTTQAPESQQVASAHNQAAPSTTTPATQSQQKPASGSKPQKPNQQENGQRPPKTRPSLADDDKRLLDTLIAEKMKNPYAAKELLTALKNPSARFVAMTSPLTSQALRVLQDADRALASMNRQSLRAGSIEERHKIELDFASAINTLAKLTAKVAIESKMNPTILQDGLVRDAMKKVRPNQPIAEAA